MRHLPYIIVMAWSALMLVACDQKGFDTITTGLGHYCDIRVTYDHRWHIVCEDGPDWEKLWDDEKYFMTYESLLPSDPDGLRALLYHDDGSHDVINLKPYGGMVNIREGHYSVLLFNNDTEYIIFNNINNENGAYVTTRSKSRADYMGSPFVDDDVNEKTITPPDMIYSRDGGEFDTGLPGDTIYMHYELRPLVYKYLLRYHFDCGLHHVIMARGAFAGMASSVYLIDGQTTSEAATLLFDINSADGFIIDDPATGEGMAYVVLNSFGVPDYPNPYFARTESSQGLSLEVMLRNGVTKSYDFDVSDQVHRQPRGGVIDVYGLVVQDEEAAPEKGSFDINIDSWNDFIEVPFM